MSKKTFMFLYSNLCMGGIERKLVEMIECYSAYGIRIIWLRYENKEIFSEWKNIVEKANVEIIHTNIDKKTFIKCDTIHFDKDEEVTAVAFEPMDLARLEKLRMEYSAVNIQCFYMVPHFKTSVYFPEQAFKYFGRKKAYKRLQNVFSHWEEQNKILFFAQRHIEAIEKNYKIKIENKENKLLKHLEATKSFDEELAKKRSERNEFRIVSCGRFEFPHKGYMVGLIKAYCELKPSFPQLKLDLIGSGEGEELLLETVSQYPDSVTKDITFVGAVDPKQLNKYFDNAHVNISVAGGVVSGAISGLVSLSARHYCYECQVYGYLPESKKNNLSENEGCDVKRYIKDLIEMPREQYIKLCRGSYNAYATTKESVNPLWLFTLKNQKETNADDIKFMKKLNIKIIRTRNIKKKIKSVLRLKRN